MKHSPFYLPPEWAPQSGIMLTWPHRDTIWADTLPMIDAVFVAIAKQVALHEKLIITCANAAHQEHIRTLLSIAKVDNNKMAIYQAPIDDIWVRDHGPIAVLQQEKPVLLDFQFNGWGGKYPADNDNLITFALHKQKAFANTTLHTINMVLEGGAIEVDGNGTLLTTTSCLLDSMRNPGLSQADIEEQLSRWFGVKKILWLENGYLAGDDTDGHIDTLARFTGPDTICYISCKDPTDEHFAALNAMEKQLRSFTNIQHQPYKLVPLPWPKARYADVDGRRLPATYANFLIINDAVLVPTYDDPADAEALHTLSLCFPHREVIGIQCLPVIQWYGSLHCMTMQLPQGVLNNFSLQHNQNFILD